MMPAVNYEPAGVIARIKKLDVGSLYKKEKKKPHSAQSNAGGWLKQHHLVLPSLTL